MFRNKTWLIRHFRNLQCCSIFYSKNLKWNGSFRPETWTVKAGGFGFCGKELELIMTWERREAGVRIISDLEESWRQDQSRWITSLDTPNMSGSNNTAEISAWNDIHKKFMWRFSNHFLWLWFVTQTVSLLTTLQFLHLKPLATDSSKITTLLYKIITLWTRFSFL